LPVNQLEVCLLHCYTTQWLQEGWMTAQDAR
jgi:hypothetical protein